MHNQDTVGTHTYTMKQITIWQVMVQVVPLKQLRQVCNFQHSHTYFNCERKMSKTKLNKITLYGFKDLICIVVQKISVSTSMYVVLVIQ